MAMDTRTGIGGDTGSDGWLRFRLQADRTGAQADIALRNAGDRWIAVAETSRGHATGIGPTARTAMTASLGRLGPAAVAELLADLRLLDVSVRLREASTG